MATSICVRVCVCVCSAADGYMCYIRGGLHSYAITVYGRTMGVEILNVIDCDGGGSVSDHLASLVHFKYKQNLMMHAFNVIECFNTNISQFAYLFVYFNSVLVCLCFHWTLEVNKMDKMYKFAYFMTLEMCKRPGINAQCQ